MISPEAGNISTFVKLVRVAMLVPAVLCFSLPFRNARGKDESDKVTVLPGFLVAFMVLVLINSTGIIPQSVTANLTDLSRWCLVTAIAGLGIKTSFQKLAVVGWKPIAMMLGETVFLLLVVLIAVLFLKVGG
jgi:uncharacterized membrane protein YadS